MNNRNGRSYCIFAAQYLPHLGGVERYTYNLARKLLERGDEVVIVTSNVQGLASYEVMEGIPIYRVPCYNLLEGRYPILKNNKEFRKIDRILNKRQFDVVIINTRFYIHSLYGARFAKKQKAKCITIDHGTSHLSVHNKCWDMIGGVYEHLITKVLQIYCKEYYGVSKACCEWLGHFHIKATGVLYNAIDLEQIKDELKHPIIDYRKELEIPIDATVVAFTGRLLKEKGILQLIQAVKKLNQNNHNVYLLIAGDGDEQKTVEEMSDSNIIPLGRLSFQQIIAMLKQSNIFCLPSFSEGFSTSILEAAACGCYIITTKRGGSKELIIDSEYGTIIDHNDVNLVYKALEKAITHPQEREHGIDKTYRRLEKNFTWDIVADKVHEI